MWDQYVLTPLTNSLLWIELYTNSAGLSVFALAIAAKVLLLPFTIAQTRWNMAVRRLQPDIQKLQQLYKNDSTRLNQEVMALYQRLGVNPTTGCLWTLVATSINLGLWVGIYQIAVHHEIFQQSFWGIPSLALPNGWPLPTPWLPYLVLPVVAGVVQALLQKLNGISGTGSELGEWGGWLVGGVAVFLPAGVSLFWVAGALFDLTYIAIVNRGNVNDQTAVNIIAVVITTLFLLPSAIVGIVTFNLWHSVWVSGYLVLAVLVLFFGYLLGLMGQPYKRSQAVYGFLPQAGWYAALYVAYGQWGASWITAVTATLSAISFSYLYGTVMERLAPRLSLEARIATQTLWGQKEQVAQLQQRLRVYEQTRTAHLLQQAKQWETSQPDRAYGRYEQIAQSLSSLKSPTAEETHHLAQAYMGMGRINEGRKKQTEAAQQYEKARKLGWGDATAALALLWAQMAKESDEAYRVYLEYIQQQREKTEERVITALEKGCRVQEKGPKQKIQTAIDRSTAVIQAMPHLEWAHYYQGLGYYLIQKPEPAISALEHARQMKPDRTTTHVYLGHAYRQTNRPHLAQTAWQEALRLDPQQPEIAFQLAQLIVEPLINQNKIALTPPEQDQVAQAAYWLDQAVRLDKKKDIYWYYLGRVRLWQADFQAASQSLEQAVALNSRQKTYCYYLAMAYRPLGKLAKIKESLQKAIALDQGYGEAHHLLADVLFEERAFETAVSHYRQVLQITPANAQAQLNLGRGLYELEQYQQAQDVLTPIASKFQEGLFCLARSQAKLRQFDAAISTWQQYLTQFGNTAQALYYLGCAYANAGQNGRLYSFDQAVESFRHCIELSPAYWQAHLQLGHTYHHLKRLTEARHSYLQAQAFQPHNPEILCALGQIAYLEGDILQAQTAFQQAIHHTPHYSPAHLGLGMLHEQKGNIPHAIDAYKHASAYLPLGILCCKQEDYRQSQTYLQKAQIAGDTSDSLLYYLGFSLVQTQNYLQAWQVWSQLQTRHPQDSHLMLNMTRLSYLWGYEQAKTGEYAQAATAWETYLQTYPEDDQVRQDLAAVYFLQAQTTLQAGTTNKETLKALHRAIELNGENNLYQYYIGLSQLVNREYPTAATIFQNVLQQQPDHLTCTYHLALSLVQQNQLEEAQKLLCQLPDLPENSELVLKKRAVLAGLYMRQQQWHLAADLFRDYP